MNRHRHLWVEIGRTWNPPMNAFQVRGCSEEAMLRMAAGFTVVELRCGECGDLRHHTVIGRSEPK